MAAPSQPPPEPISFQLERLHAAGGRLEVAGRWYGVRGLRFMRPSLTVVCGADRRRLLAELDHKPWEAHDGEPWVAEFPFPGDLDDVSELELSVSTDIAVSLAARPVRGTDPPPAPAQAGTLPAPRLTGAPVDAGERPRRAGDLGGKSERGGNPGGRPERARDPGGRPESAGGASGPAARPALSDRARELERLNERLVVLDTALERERGRRTAAERELDEERAEVRRLRALGAQLRAELDLARTVHAEAATVSAELDSTRRELANARTAVAEMGERLGRTEAEGDELRRRLQAAEAGLEAARRGPAPPATSPRGAEPVLAAPPAPGQAGPGRGSAGRGSSAGRGGSPLVRLEPEDPLPRYRGADEHGGSRAPWLGHGVGVWIARGLAVLVVLAAIVVVILLIGSTVSL